MKWRWALLVCFVMPLLCIHTNRPKQTHRDEGSPFKYIPSPSSESQWLLPFHLQSSIAWIVASEAKTYSFLKLCKPDKAVTLNHSLSGGDIWIFSIEDICCEFLHSFVWHVQEEKCLSRLSCSLWSAQRPIASCSLSSREMGLTIPMTPNCSHGGEGARLGLSLQEGSAAFKHAAPSPACFSIAWRGC